MIRLVASVAFAASVLAAQPATSADLMKLTDELEAAIQAGDWPKAAQLSRSLRGATEEARNQSMAAAGSELVDSILTWLPSDTETLVVAQEPFTLSTRHENKIPGALEEAQGYVLGPLAAAESENLLMALVGRTVRLAALGARRFGEEPPGDRPPDAPAPLGMIPYQGCGVYSFTEPIKEPLLKRPPEDSIMGHLVWISKGSQNDRPDAETYYVSLLKSDVVMACNNRDFFQELVSRIGLPQRLRALPANLPEWKQVDRTAPVWAVCHYRESRMLSAILSAGGKDFGATGLTVEFGHASGPVKARLMAGSDPWKALVDNLEFKGAATSRNVGSGVWELTVDGGPDAAGFAVFALMAVLGFVVLL